MGGRHTWKRQLNEIRKEHKQIPSLKSIFGAIQNRINTEKKCNYDLNLSSLRVSQNRKKRNKKSKKHQQFFMSALKITVLLYFQKLFFASFQISEFIELNNLFPYCLIFRIFQAVNFILFLDLSSSINFVKKFHLLLS